MYYNYPNSYFVWGSIIHLVIWIIIIVLVIWIVRSILWAGGHGHHHHFQAHQKDRVLALLDERYAKGEINREEYEQKKKDITGEMPSSK